MKLTSTLLAIVTLLSGCSLRPFVYTSDRFAIVSLGGSLATKSDVESATLTKGDLSMIYTVTKKDETAVPKAFIAAELATNLADIQAGVTKAGTTADVAKSKISAGKAVKITRSNNALEAAKIAPQ